MDDFVNFSLPLFHLAVANSEIHKNNIAAENGYAIHISQSVFSIWRQDRHHGPSKSACGPSFSREGPGLTQPRRLHLSAK
jgi:hypothetical protein